MYNIIAVAACPVSIITIQAIPKKNTNPNTVISNDNSRYTISAEYPYLNNIKANNVRTIILGTIINMNAAA